MGGVLISRTPLGQKCAQSVLVWLARGWKWLFQVWFLACCVAPAHSAEGAPNRFIRHDVKGFLSIATDELLYETHYMVRPLAINPAGGVRVANGPNQINLYLSRLTRITFSYLNVGEGLVEFPWNDEVKALPLCGRFLGQRFVAAFTDDIRVAFPSFGVPATLVFAVRQNLKV